MSSTYCIKERSTILGSSSVQKTIHQVLQWDSCGSQELYSTPFNPFSYEVPAEGSGAALTAFCTMFKAAAPGPIKLGGHNLQPRLPAASVWVGSLRPTVSSEQVKSAFSAFGKVLRVEGPFANAWINGNPNRAWAIIDFDTPWAAELACLAFANKTTSECGHEKMTFEQNIVAESQKLLVRRKERRMAPIAAAYKLPTPQFFY